MKKFFTKRKKDLYEKSCGVILYREGEGQEEFLLLHYPSGHWDFPKGHVEEADESETHTARRELEEETGIKEVQFVSSYRKSMYYEFDRGKRERVKKVVVYFLAKTKEKDVTLSFEHKNFIWLPYNEAMEKLTFENAQVLLRSAKSHVHSPGTS